MNEHDESAHILAALKMHPEGLTSLDIKEMRDISQHLFDKIMVPLLESGKVRRGRLPGLGRAFVYRLVEDGQKKEEKRDNKADAEGQNDPTLEQVQRIIEALTSRCEPEDTAESAFNDFMDEFARAGNRLFGRLGAIRDKKTAKHQHDACCGRCSGSAKEEASLEREKASTNLSADFDQNDQMMLDAIIGALLFKESMKIPRGKFPI